jgi:crotonobetainyl-CoA:carnitine CoA-transferase CaiB-like acyl-CoA transferase
MHTLPCADGYVHLECLEEIQWRRFVSLIGNPDWVDLEIFQDLASRGKNWDALKLLIIDAIKDWKAEELSVKSQAAGVPCSVVRKPSDLVLLRKTITPDFFVEINHPIAGELLFPGNPYRLSIMPDVAEYPAPSLGQHNKEIICGDMGVPEESLARLRSLQVI